MSIVPRAEHGAAHPSCPGFGASAYVNESDPDASDPVTCWALVHSHPSLHGNSVPVHTSIAPPISAPVNPRGPNAIVAGPSPLHGNDKSPACPTATTTSTKQPGLDLVSDVTRSER